MSLVTHITPACLVCGQKSKIKLDSDQLRKYTSGARVQDAFPRMGAPERELVLTGTHGSCWDKVMPDDD